MNRSQTIAVLLLSVAHGMNHAYLVFFAPLLVIMREDLGVDHLAVGTLVTLAYVMNGIGALPAGMAGDRIGHKRTIILSTAVAAAGCGLAAASGSYWGLAAGFLLIGSGASLYHPPGMAYVSLAVGAGAVGKAMGYHGIGANILLVAAPVASGLVAVWYSWHAAFAMWAVLGGLLAIILWLFLPAVSAATARSSQDEAPQTVEGGEVAAAASPPAAQAAGFRARLKPLFTGPMKLVLVITMLHGIAFTGLFTYLAPYLQDVHGVSVEMTSWVMALVFAGGIIGQPFGGSRADSRGRFVPLIESTVLVVLGLAVVTFALGPVALFAAAFYVGFLSFMLQPPTTALVSDLTGQQVRGLAFGLFFLLTNVAGGLTPLVAGFLGDYGHLQWLFILLAVVQLASLPLVLRLRRLM